MLSTCKTSWSLVTLFLVMIILTFKEVKGDGCKTVGLLPKKAGSYLRNHVVQTAITQSQSMCRVKCYLSDSCLSYNFHESSGTCEINNSDEFQHPNDMISMPGYIYVGTENGCQSSPCPSNKTCQADFTYEGGFKCLCPSGFTGPSCNIDIDECTSQTDNCTVYSYCKNTRGSFDCIPLILGTKELPAKSCLDILVNGFSKGTGVYMLDPKNKGTPIEAFCDMTTDGGGWTKVKMMYLENSIVPHTKILNTYHVIAEYNNNQKSIIPTIRAMSEIQQAMGFHQIHFYCHKKSVGRVLSIMTKNNTAGQQVVRSFTTSYTSFPDACGSFERLPEDKSVLAQNCSLWGEDPLKTFRVNKWGSIRYTGQYRLVTKPFSIEGDEEYAFSCFNHSEYERCSCDDSFNVYRPVNINDTWHIAVR